MDYKFCMKCGSPLDPITKQCPKCSAQAFAQPQRPAQPMPPQHPVQPGQPMPPVPPQPAKPKKKKTGIIIGACVGGGVLLIAIIVVVVVLIVRGGGSAPASGDDGMLSNVSKPVQMTYATYMAEVMLEEIGEFDEENPKFNNTGINSAIIADMDGKDEEELVAIYTEDNGDVIDYNIALYGIADGADLDGDPSADNVKLINKIYIESFDDYLDNDEDDWSMPYEVMAYAFDYDGQKYISVDILQYYEGSSFANYMYAYVNGELVEMSNVFVPNIGSDGTAAVNSTNLPAGLNNIDNSDYIDREYYELADFGNMLYFSLGGSYDDSYVYDTYYSSVDDAVAGYYATYGITKNGYDNGDTVNEELGRYCAIPVPTEDVEMLYSYAFYTSYSDMYERSVNHFDITDYSKHYDLIKQILDKDKGEPRKAESADFDLFLKMIKGSSDAWVTSYLELSDYAPIDSYYEYIINSYGENGMYKYFFGADTILKQSSDPKYKFDYDTYKLDASKVDWIIQNVFGRQPLRSISSYEFYYNGEYFYHQKYDDYDSDIKYEFTLGDTKELEDGKYAITVFVKATYPSYDGSKPTVITYDMNYVAHLANDASIGDYWAIDQFTLNSAVQAQNWDNTLTKKDVTVDELKKQYQYCYDYYNGFFYGGSQYQDQNEAIKSGDFYIVPSHYGKIATSDQLLAETKKYFSDATATQMHKDNGIKDINGQLYSMMNYGVGDYCADEYITITKVNDTKYKVESKLVPYDSEDDNDPYIEYETRYFIYENGRWVLDDSNIFATTLHLD